MPFLKRGLPEKGMPAFATMPDSDLKDIAEFVHLQVEQVANRGSYHVLNILVGDAAKGQAYVANHCSPCHNSATFMHFGSKFRSTEQLQKGWIWPARDPDSGDSRRAITAVVKTHDGNSIAGRVIRWSDFRITLVDSSGKTQQVDLNPGVDLKLNNPLAAHQEMTMTLSNDEMHNVTAYLDSLK